MSIFVAWSHHCFLLMSCFLSTQSPGYLKCSHRRSCPRLISRSEQGSAQVWVSALEWPQLQRSLQGYRAPLGVSTVLLCVTPPSQIKWVWHKFSPIHWYRHMDIGSGYGSRGWTYLSKSAVHQAEYNQSPSSINNFCDHMKCNLWMVSNVGSTNSRSNIGIYIYSHD